MYTKIRKMLALAVVTLGLVAVPLVAMPATTFAQGTDLKLTDKLKCGTNLDINDPDNCNANTGNSSSNFNKIIRDIINIFSIVVGIIAIIMMIWAGAMFISSKGEPTQVGNARSTIIYALVGLVIVAIAQFVVQFVLEKVSTTVV